MIVRISPAHPFRLAFDTLVVEGGGNSEVEEVAEAVAEAVADAVEDVAEAVSDAVSDAGSGGPPAEWVERIVKLELAVDALGLAIAEVSGSAQAAQSAAGVALEVAEEATTPEEVVEIVGESAPDPVVEIEEAADEPPAGTGKSLVFASGQELKERFFRKGSDD